VSEPHQRLTRLPLDAPSAVSALAVVVHWPEALAVRAGVSTAGAAAAWAFGPCDPGVTDVEKAAIQAAPSAEPPAPFYGELLEGHIGYLRLGSLKAANLAAMDNKLADFGKKIDALIVDLRASTTTSDFGIASDFAKRFCPKGKTLFTLHKASKQDRAFTSDRDPAYQGLIIVLTDAETSGGAEIIAAALRFYDKALLIGQATAGRAVEYSDLPLPSGKLLRVAASEALSADGHSLYPAGVKPDLPVEMSMVDKRYVFQLSMEKGLGPFIYETERPHMNEAALIAGCESMMPASV